MYAITGITGKVGGAAARILMAGRKRVRAVVRDPAKAQAWKDKEAEIAVAEMGDAAALTKAFTGVEAVFILLPPTFDPSPGFVEAKATISAVKQAILSAKPGRVVLLSTIGAQAKQENLLTQLGLAEQALTDLPMPLAILRPGWFMENASWDMATARDTGVIHSFLQPLDQKFPMIATADVGRAAAELLMNPDGHRQLVEIEGPSRISPNELAAAMAQAVGRVVRAEVVQRATWEQLFASQGMRHPTPRMRMLDGFSEGWIAYEHPDRVRKGTVTLDTVLRSLVS